MSAEFSLLSTGGSKLWSKCAKYRRGFALVFLGVVPFCAAFSQTASFEAPPPTVTANSSHANSSQFLGGIFADPLRTEPLPLDRGMRTHLPPELSIGSDLREFDEGTNDIDARPLVLSCASRLNADSADSPRWALQTLRDSSDGRVPELTLPLAIQLAICHNPALRGSWSQIGQRAAQLGQAKSAYWPQLNASVGHQRSTVNYSNTNFPSRHTQAATQNLVLNWRLWDFGVRSARTAAAQAELSAALSSQNATLQKVLEEALHLYSEAQAAEAQLHTQKSLMPLADRNVLSAQRRQAGGAGSAGDVLQTITVQARVQLEQSRAEGELNKAYAKLNYQLGLPAGVAYTLPPLLPREAATLGGRQTAATDRLISTTLDEWLEHVRENHPAIASARAQLAAARAGVNARKSDGLPTVDLNLGHYRNGRPDQALSAVRSRENVVGISVNIPLFTGFANTYQVREAQAIVEQKHVLLQATEQQTLQELVQSHAEAHTTLRNLQAAIELHNAANAAAQSAQRQYERRVFDIQQLNQSLTTLQQAQHDLVRSQLEWNRARLKLWLTAMPGSECGLGSVRFPLDVACRDQGCR